MNWVLVPQAFVNGVLSGGIIALIALGVVLIYKSSEVFNFAQGHMLMLGAFLTWWFAGGSHTGEELVNLPLGFAVLAAFITAALIGFLIERLALRPMSGQPLLSIVLMTLGLSQLIEGLTVLMYGVSPRDNFPTPFGLSPGDVFVIPFKGAFGDAIRVSQIQVVAFITAMLAALAFGLFFRYTRVGLSMRAASEDHELARSVGLNVPRIFALSWAIAGIIATTGGILLATLSGATLSLSTVVLIAFPAILLGGLESLPGAVIGGIAIGLTQFLVQTSKVIEIRNSSDIAPYVLLLIVLLFRPEGLFGRERIERI